jgi:hypothetical protein
MKKIGIVEILLWVILVINLIMKEELNAILIMLFIMDNHIEDLKK